jgi:hypothetical protein
MVALVVAGAALPASAQVFGTYSWQMQPFCNRITLTLTTVTGNFTLDGSDDQCGAAKQGSAAGIGVFNPDGTVSLNFTIVASPSGIPVHVSANVSPANGQGTWSDDSGNTGTFAFFGNTGGLPPLPAGPVRFRAANAENAPVAGGGTTVRFSSLTYNAGGGTYNAAAGTYTVPATGTYLLTAGIRFDPPAVAAGYYCLTIEAGGNALQYQCATQSAAIFVVPHLSFVRHLTAGQVLSVVALQVGGGAQTVSGNADTSEFSVTRLH